jgi:large subunit ribosomal protein L11
MSEESKVTVKALVTGGKASGGPPIGPAIGPTGINIKDVVDAVNEKTAVFEGLTVPVRIECDATSKEFEIFVETPSTASLLLKEAGLSEGSEFPGDEIIANLEIANIINVAKAKWNTFYDKTFKAAVKTVLGTAHSIGLTIEGEDPRVIQKRVDDGQYDEQIEEGKPE